MNTTILIPYRNDPLWRWTADNAKRTAPEAWVLPEEDEPRMGLGQRRHKMIADSDTEYVALVDAHMDFQPGWIDAAIEHLRIQPDSLVCFECRGLTDTLESVAMNRAGATIEPWNERGQLLMSRWLPVTGGVRQVPEVLGGAYVFRRDWYMDGIGGVWKWHTGWGKSEQMVSIMTYLCGGRCVALPEWTAHKFRRTNPNPVADWQLRRNMFLIVYGMTDAPWRDKLLATRGNITDTYGRRDLDRIGAIEAVQAHLQRHGQHTFSKFMEFCDTFNQRG